MWLPWFGMGFIFLLPILWLIVSILLCIWVYRDAKDRGEEAVLWLLVVLIANIIGLIIWLVVRPEKERKQKENVKYCQNCGAEITPDSKYCPECGEKIG